MESLKEWINASLSAEKTRVSITDFEEDFKVCWNRGFDLGLTTILIGWDGLQVSS